MKVRVKTGDGCWEGHSVSILYSALPIPWALPVMLGQHQPPKRDGEPEAPLSFALEGLLTAALGKDKCHYWYSFPHGPGNVTSGERECPQNCLGMWVKHACECCNKWVELKNGRGGALENRNSISSAMVQFLWRFPLPYIKLCVWKMITTAVLLSNRWKKHFIRFSKYWHLKRRFPRIDLELFSNKAY